MPKPHPRTQLCFIIKQYGPSIIAEPKRCKGLLSDLAPEHRLEINLLIAALEQKVAQELLQPNALIPMDMQLDLLAQRLHDVAGIKEEFAYWAVESWALALGVIQQPMPKQTGQSKAKTTPTPPPKVTPSPTIKPIELPAYKLGDILPGGGIVFYVDASGQRGLAAQPKDETKKATWREAQRLAIAHGQSWRLPIRDELRLLYAQRNVVGGFVNDYYWSSTENDSNTAFLQNFTNGNQYKHNKNTTLPVRAVRTFGYPL